MTLTKTHLIDAIAEQNGFTKNHSSELFETLLEIIKKSLESGENVLISNFGKFCVKEKGERRGRNPSTGDSMMMRSRKVVTFRWSGKLRKKINGLPG
jgi:integration host factor subunit alpha